MKLPTYHDLSIMRNVDIQYINPDEIPDIRDIYIDGDKPLFERTLDYINQTKNPYCIRCGKTLVKIVYSETETTIEDCMEGYFRSLM